MLAEGGERVAAKKRAGDARNERNHRITTPNGVGSGRSARDLVNHTGSMWCVGLLGHLRLARVCLLLRVVPVAALPAPSACLFSESPSGGGLGGQWPSVRSRVEGQASSLRNGRSIWIVLTGNGILSPFFCASYQIAVRTASAASMRCSSLATQNETS